MKTMNQILKKSAALQYRLTKKQVRENFGDKEMRLLDDFIGSPYDYSYDNRLAINTITGNFFDFCVNYTG
jgi:hypothetical protein